MKLPEQFWMAIVFLGFLAIAYVLVTDPDERVYVQEFAVMAPLAAVLFAVVAIYLLWKLLGHFRAKEGKSKRRKLYK